MFDTPVLLLIFNRLTSTKSVFEQIKKIKPATFYIAADGPRKGNDDDRAKCTEVRDFVLAQIDWDCKVSTLFREDNLGCRSAVSEAINWFFKHEEMGIILEDDCLADQSFFTFCQQALTVYKDDEDIIAVNGCNFNFPSNSSDSYFFSRYMNVWGWATWRRSAKMIDYNMTSWNNASKLYFLWTRLRQNLFDFDIDWYRYWSKNFDAITSKALNTWDYQWQYYQWLTRKKTIVASKNLLINIGFGVEATHTSMKSHPAATLRLETIGFPLKKPSSKHINKDYEETSVKPVWHLHTRKPTRFYLLNYINTIPFVQLFRAKLKT